MAAPPGFDFTKHVRHLCGDIVSRLGDLRHVDMARVAVRVCQTRRRGRHGLHASLTPLRFEGGRREVVRRGRTWTIRPLLDAAGLEMLYLLSFYLPRFCDQPFEEKLATVMHELWHIGPSFDGDIRRLPGRCYAHGRREHDFHVAMHQTVQQWLALGPPAELHEFLRCDFGQLRRQHGGVHGIKIPTPKLVLVAASKG
ncbi:MAG: hypothetical protein HYX69_19200 [Planctomycetia bacterium]|nr:hypothetical protein [Planctomycetia bacterium]